ncbi:MAG: S-layer homology domain-containing protein [Oscillospiraceae bacterium]|nr:S-layer homology domain-containing protein [Oscillospiraceae bacterium]
MKRIISALLSVVFAFSAFPITTGSTGADDKDLEKAILTVKGRVKIPDEYSKFSFERTTGMGQTGYTLTWNNPDSENRDEISVSIVDDILLSYFKSDGNYFIPMSEGNGPQRRFAKLSKEQLHSAAASTIRRLNPTVHAEIKVDKDSFNTSVSSQSASFRICRTVNSIEVQGDSGNISLDKDTGELLSFNMSWLKGVNFPSNNSIHNQSRAKEAYTRLIGIEPLYVINSDWQKKTQSAIIIFRPKNDNFIDALDGRLSSFEPNYYGWSGGGAIAMNEELAFDGDFGAPSARVEQLTEAEREKVNVEKDLLTANQAFERLMNESLYLHFGENPSLRSSNLSTEFFDEDKYVWDLSIQFRGANNTGTGAQARVDAKTGTVMSYSHWVNAQASENLDTRIIDSSVQSALQRYLGEAAFSQYKLESATTQTQPRGRGDTANQPQYTGRNYQYVRYVNNIMVRNDTISVNVNSDGKITSFNYTYTNIRFPSADNILKIDEALKRLYSQQDMTLKYYINVDNNTSGGGRKTSALLYSMPPFFLNAVSGRLCDYSGNEINTSTYSYSDIGNHPIKNVAEKLADNGIMLPAINGRLRPNTQITTEDFGGLLSNIGIYVPYDEKNASKPLSRREAVIIFIDGLGGKEFARLGGIYAALFKDVANADRGYFALAAGLKIITPDSSGNARPGAALTRAGALQMVHDYLA